MQNKSKYSKLDYFVNTNLPFVNLLFGLADLNIFLVLGLALECFIAPPLNGWWLVVVL